ncbi:MAG: hypothetical protein KC501_20050 [Myxococcales bacterium]|nr:hypothetical protein [Myxococcales bacterium]
MSRSSARHAVALGIALVGLLGLGSGCAQRFKLADLDLQEAKDAGDLGALRVYPSNRTISIYDEPALRAVTIDREIRQSSRRKQHRQILRRGTAGAVIGEDRLNGQKLLYVTFDRSCAAPECAYRFVQVEDARYVLMGSPEREGYAPPKVHRSIRIKRHRMKLGHLHALTEANQVFRLERKRRVPVVFLEIKRSNRDKVEGQSGRESGV